MTTKIRKYIKPSPERVAHSLRGPGAENPTLKGKPPVSQPRRARPAATVTGREWRVDPLVAGLSLLGALLVGVVVSSLLIMRARPAATARPVIVASPNSSSTLSTAPVVNVPLTDRSTEITLPTNKAIGVTRKGTQSSAGAHKPAFTSAKPVVIRRAVARTGVGTSYASHRKRKGWGHKGKGHGHKRGRHGHGHGHGD